MADVSAIAKQFTDYYYQTFDADRNGLAPLYASQILTWTERDHSMLSFESQQILGGKAILEKLVGLPFQTVQHRVSTLDAHPASSTDASIIVLVTGQLITGDEANPLSFSQTFQLIPEGGSYFVLNDIFRLVYG